MIGCGGGLKEGGAMILSISELWLLSKNEKRWYIIRTILANHQRFSFNHQNDPPSILISKDDSFLYQLNKS